MNPPPVPAFAAIATAAPVRRASSWMNGTVRDPVGEKIGQIEDLVVDESTGQIAAAVLSFGGFLGIGEKRFAIPLSRFTRSADDTCFVAKLTQSSLERAPSFAPGSWPKFDHGYIATVQDYFRDNDRSSTAPAAGIGPLGKEELDPERLHARGLERVSKVMGAAVVGVDGVEIGHLDDLAIEDGTHRIRYAVLSFGGFLGLGDKLFAIPWSSLGHSESDGNSRWVLDVAKARLELAPGFDKNSWPDFADRRWGAQVHSYYGQQPW